MAWLNIDYTDKTRDFSRFLDGSHASFSVEEIDGKKYLAKKYNCIWDYDHIKNIRKFRNLTYDKVNAFPVGSIFIRGKEVGYLSNYYDGAVNFSDDFCSLIPYDTRYQATLDISSQLRFLHENGFIVNDIRLANNLVSFRGHCGVMVDFEDMILENHYKFKQAYYYFYKLDSQQNILSPSKWEDVKKQFVCNTSILLDENLEKFVIYNGVKEFLEKFQFDSDIYEFAKTLFNSEEILYFDEIAPRFQDEERVKYYAKSLVENK